MRCEQPLETGNAPGNPQSLVRRGRGAAGRRAADRQVAQADRHHAGGRHGLSPADRGDRADPRRRRQPGAARPDGDPRPDPVRHSRAALGPRADPGVRVRQRRQQHRARLFQQPRLGEEEPADGRAAHRRRQARSLWRRVADHPSRRGRGRRRGRHPGARARLSADRRASPTSACASLPRHAIERAPELAEWIEPSLLAKQGWSAWRGALAAAHADPGKRSAPAPRLRRSVRQPAGAAAAAPVVAAQARGAAGRRRPADRRAQAALPADRRPAAGDRRDPRRHGAERADAPAAAGRRRLGQDVGRAGSDAGRGRGGRPGGAAGADRNPRPPAFRHLVEAADLARRPRRHPHRPREGQGARKRADGPRRGRDRHPRRHPRDLPGQGRLQEPRPRGDRRAAPLRRLAAPAPLAKGRAAAAPAGDDRDPDPAHADAHPLWRDGRQPDRRDAARAGRRSKRG